MSKKLTDIDVDRIIDIPVGANKGLDSKLEKDDPFLNRELGAYDDNQGGKWVSWGITPLDPGKNSARNLAYQKAKYHASLAAKVSDDSEAGGVRLDCFQGNMFAADGTGVLPEYKANPTALADSLFYGVRDGGADPNKSFAEHLPYQEKYDAGVVNRYLENKSKEVFKGASIPRLSVAKWNNFGPESFDSNGSHEIAGYHQDYPGNREKIKEGFVDLFTRGMRKVMLPFTDIIARETYNIGNTTNDTNWTMRLKEGNGWEENYQEKLQDGFGFNAPETFAKVLAKKGKNDAEGKKLQSVLGRFGQLLREKNPEIKTRKAADEKLGADYIDPELKALLK
jgi:hypothetical protein